ncbi:MAG TPA: hypothetical protein ENJ78_01200 [candidate division WWE3 bacterium]|uniref:Uncharacterized protein n=1 Tax=candidate division WWE3 bacterium TaxID=2053526 RepID=A0A7V5J2P2_UNCKA|nr:hypothetical protein [candidate division WWE3 bacterium]
MQNLNKIKKLINQASSQEPAETLQASKMASALMVREGVNFSDLLKYKDELYLDGLMSTARVYAQRTTKTHTEAQKLSASIYQQINEAYNKSSIKADNNYQEKARLQREREELERKAQELRQKEADIFKKEQQSTHQQTEDPIYATDFKNEPQKYRTSHNIRIGNYFLRMLILHPFLTFRLFIRSFFQALIVSLLIMVFVMIFSVLFDMDLTFSLSYLAMYEGLVFVLLIAYTLVNIRGWYPSE